MRRGEREDGEPAEAVEVTADAAPAPVATLAAPSGAGHVLAMQRGAGNAAVSRLLSRRGAALEVSRPGDPREREADAIAEAALAGRPIAAPAAGSGPAVARFAQNTTDIKRNPDGTSTYRGGAGHAGMTEEALHTMGLGVEEARAGRMGNWERDLSQALTPGTVGLIGAENIMPFLNILAIKEFGRGIDLAEFGTYDPVEHIDNPAGLRASDVFGQVPIGPPTSPTADLDNPSNPDAGSSADLEGTQGPGNLGQAEADRRYAGTPTHGEIMNPGDAAAFQVDESGIPRYMNTSKLWLTGKLHQSARLGRHNQDGLGPREFSSGIHTMQDYYAHSNFCEIAINLLIRAGVPMFVPAGEAAGPGQPRPGAVRDMDASRGVLDTMVHGNDASGNPVAGNLAFNGREVMTTGTFNLTDTAASILEEVGDKLKEMNPFDAKSTGPSETTMAILDYLEMDPESPADFSGFGQGVAERIRSINTVVDSVVGTGADIAEGAGDLAGGAVRDAGSAVSGALGVANSINSLLGGDADYWDEEREAVDSAAGGTATAVEGAGGEVAAALRSISEQIEAYAADWADDQHSLRKAYTWVHDHSPMEVLKRTARAIPLVGEPIAAAIESFEQWLREQMEATLGAAWNAAVTKAVAGLNRVIAAIRAETDLQKKRAEAGTGAAGKLGGLSDMYDANGNPLGGIAPASYTPPSHTEIAKDHGDILNPAADSHADDPAEGLDHDHDDHDHEGTDDEHGHQHLASYLAPVADRLGHTASLAVGAEVAKAWDVVDAGGTPSEAHLQAIDKVVAYWFNHPADNRESWEADIKALLLTPRVGGAVYDRLNATR